MTATHYDAGRVSYIKGEPLDADYGTRVAKLRRNIFDNVDELANQHQRDYEAGRLAAAERARRRRA